MDVVTGLIVFKEIGYRVAMIFESVEFRMKGRETMKSFGWND